MSTYDNWAKYPDEDGLRVGCKVSWRYYHSKEDAETCALAAKNNGRIMAGQGYDFGYCAPGAITKVAEDSNGEFAGMYEVTLP